jgi:hypothetical protein
MKNPYNSFAREQQGMRNRRVILIASMVIFVAIILLLTVISVITARQTPNQKITSAIQSSEQKAVNSPLITAGNLHRSGDFASASVGYKSSAGTVVYRINKDGSVSKIVGFNNMDPGTFSQLRQAGLSVDNIASLLDMTQSKLLATVMAQCNYTGGDTPGYQNFSSVRYNGAMAIGQGAMSIVADKLSAYLTTQNSGKPRESQIACVSAISSDNAPREINAGTITTSWQVQFIDWNGNESTHDMAYSAATSNFSLTLDGQQI